MTKEKMAVGAFLSAMHEQGLDGAKVREAMHEVLGLTVTPLPSNLQQGASPHGYSLVCNRCGKWAEYCQCETMTSGDKGEAAQVEPWVNHRGEWTTDNSNRTGYATKGEAAQAGIVKPLKASDLRRFAFKSQPNDT